MADALTEAATALCDLYLQGPELVVTIEESDDASSSPPPPRPQLALCLKSKDVKKKKKEERTKRSWKERQARLLEIRCAARLTQPVLPIRRLPAFVAYAFDQN